MTPATSPAMVPVRSANRAVVRVLSDICFILGFASIGLSILVWLTVAAPDPGYGERLGIFVGLWAPTFFALSDRLGRYGKPSYAEAAEPLAPASRENWGA